MKTMAIDYGRSRVGIALSDALGIIAQPLLTLPAEPRKELINRLKSIIEENGVAVVLVGNPLSNRGTATPMSDAVAAFAERLKKATGVEVRLWDERYTSRYAATRMKELGISGSKKKKRIDQIAASIMLDEYLNSSPPVS